MSAVLELPCKKCGKSTSHQYQESPGRDPSWNCVTCDHNVEPRFVQQLIDSSEDWKTRALRAEGHLETNQKAKARGRAWGGKAPDRFMRYRFR